MEQQFDSGLFTELEGLWGHDQVFYEDTPKQQDLYTLYSQSSVTDSFQQKQPFAELKGVGQTPFNGEKDEFDLLLAQGNDMLDRFMTENGLNLLSTPVDLADVDELVSDSFADISSSEDAIRPADLDDVTTAYSGALDDMYYSTELPGAGSTVLGYPELASPASSISTLPSEPASPVNLFPVMNSVATEMAVSDETQTLDNLLMSLMGDDDLATSSKGCSDNTVASLSSPACSADESYSDVSGVCSPGSSADGSYYYDELDCSSPSPKAGTSGKRRSKATPYSKLPAGRKERKKQQNKEAAIRYREKKRQEAMQSQSEEQGLLDRNKELKTEVLNLEREIMCMKELLSDVFNIHSL